MRNNLWRRNVTFNLIFCIFEKLKKTLKMICFGLLVTDDQKFIAAVILSVKAKLSIQACNK